MSQPMEHQVNLEVALYDVLFDICRILDLKTLRNLALVCRSWSYVAMKELSKRRPGPLLRVVLPVYYCKYAPRFKWKEHFSNEPNTFLIFCGPHAYQRPMLELEYKVMDTFYKRIPGRSINLGVDMALINIHGEIEEVIACKKCCGMDSDGMLNDHIVGLSLPKCEGYTIEVVECVSHEEPAQMLANEVFRQISEAAEGVANPIFLVFSRSGYSIGDRFMKMFQEKYAGKPVSLWGSTIADHIKRDDDGYPDYRGTHGLLVLLVHAPRLRAYCAVVPINDDETITKRLVDFRSSLRLKRRSLGLLCGPRSTGDNWSWDDPKDRFEKKRYFAKDLMKMVVKQMEGIEFMGMFNNPRFHYYGCDHGSKSQDYSLQHKNVISIMILTFD